MAVRRILLLGEEALRDPGVEVEAFDDELHDLIEDMLETMYFAEGIGLAAPQIGVSRRVCVLGGGRQNKWNAWSNTTRSWGRRTRRVRRV